MSPRHSDSDQGWIKREFKDIRRQMREDRAAKKLQAATVGKGGVTIRDGGSLVSKYAVGTNAVIIGPAFPDSPADGSQIALLDEGGGVILYAYRLPVSVDNPSGAAAVMAQGDFINLLSKSSTAQIYLDDTILNLVGGTGGVRVAHSTTGASANCFIDPSDARIWRSTSSARRKVDIEDAEIDPDAVLKMRGVTFRDKGQVETDPDTQTRYVGFIAEELHDLGLTEFVDYDDEGKPDAISYDRLSVALLAVIKSQDARLTALEERLADEGPAKS